MSNKDLIKSLDSLEKITLYVFEALPEADEAGMKEIFEIGLAAVRNLGTCGLHDHKEPCPRCAFYEGTG